MSTEEHKDEQLIQLSRHTHEWSNNTTLEEEARYLLGGRHRYEHKCLVLGNLDSSERVLLIARHIKEISQLKQFNGEVRIAIGERHLQEKVYLDGLLTY